MTQLSSFRPFPFPPAFPCVSATSRHYAADALPLPSPREIAPLFFTILPCVPDSISLPTLLLLPPLPGRSLTGYRQLVCSPHYSEDTHGGDFYDGAMRRAVLLHHREKRVCMCVCAKPAHKSLLWRKNTSLSLSSTLPLSILRTINTIILFLSIFVL